jgi:hypothetical protein
VGFLAILQDKKIIIAKPLAGVLFSTQSKKEKMSPTVFRYKNYRFFFFSREETRMHVHISSPDGEAKFWIEPVVALADYSGFSERQLKELLKVVEKHEKEITKAWKKHFSIG